MRLMSSDSVLTWDLPHRDLALSQSYTLLCCGRSDSLHAMNFTKPKYLTCY